MLTPRPYPGPSLNLNSRRQANPSPTDNSPSIERPRTERRSHTLIHGSKTVSDPSDTELDGRAAGQPSLRLTSRPTTRGDNLVYPTRPADSSSRSRSPDLSSLLRRDNMASILQWALKVAEEHVRGQQAAPNDSTNDHSRSRSNQQQVPLVGSQGSAGQSTSTRRYDVDTETLRAAQVVAKGKPRVSPSSRQLLSLIRVVV